MKRNFKSKQAFFFILFFFIPYQTALGETAFIEDEYQENWDDEYILRTGHHLSASLGVFGSSWDIPGVGPKAQHFIEKKLTYSFDLPIAWGLSYFLGSSFGYAADFGSYDQNMGASYGRFIFPGFLLGLSYTFSTRSKASIGGIISWSRALGLYYHDVCYRFTVRTLPEVFIKFDYFLSPNWGINASLNYKRESLQIEDGEIRKHLSPFPEAIRESAGLLIGVTYHRL